MPIRRRGSRAGRQPTETPPEHLPAGLRPSSVETLVARALDGIPERFQPALGQVAIVIEDAASDEQLRSAGVRPGSDLYGLYEGVPRTVWGADLAAVPSKISLFRLPLEADFPDPDQLEIEVRRTVVHELAHHVGIDDARLDELGIG
ncbi:MAG: metallopeptidase family protein [Candidatus Limnocylindrales bacterium]